MDRQKTEDVTVNVQETYQTKEYDLFGRPTKYKPDYPQKVMEYIETTGRENTSLPTIAGFAIFLGVCKRTINYWAEKYPDFLRALGAISTHQEQQCLDDGIYGGKEVNSTIVKLVLMNNHGYKERKDNTTNDKDLPTPIYGGNAT